MTSAYARTVQAPTGTMQARDLRDRDIILIRKPGAIDRTPETVQGTMRDGNDIILNFDGWEHRLSPTMTVALAGRN